jgi:hypothetical protein
MSLNRRIGLGVTIAVDASGGTSFTTLGNVVDGAKEGGTKAQTGDVSILADTFMQFAKGQIDPGEKTFTIAYDPDDSNFTVLKTLHDQIQTTPPNWQISLPSGTLGAGSTTTKTYKGFVVGMGREIAKDKLLTLEVTVKKTGDPGM